MMGIDKHTLCCLHFDEAVTKDECGNTWNIVGDNISIDSNGKFGKSLKLGGNSKITTAPFMLGTNDFTVDCWVKFQGINQYYGCLFSLETTNIINLPSIFSVYCDGSGLLGLTGPDTALQLSSLGSSLTKDVFQHLAAVRKGNAIFIFLNGKKIKMVNFNTLDLSNPAYLITIGDWGLENYGSSFYRSFIGNIDEFRISDIARWTEDFTPPVSPYTKSLKLYLDENNAVWGCRQ